MVEAKTKNEHLITPCPVCYSEDECPHTPVRCRHGWWYGDLKQPAIFQSCHDPKPGTQRTCEWCGRVERAVLDWEPIKA